MKQILMAMLAAVSLPALADVAIATSESGSQSTSNSQTNASQANGQSIEFNSPGKTDGTIRYPGTQRISTAPTIYAPSMNTTSPCMVAVSGGVSIVGVGVTGGSAVEDKDCTRREADRIRAGVAQTLFAIGQPVAAAKMMCNDAEAAKALGDICSGAPAAVPKEQASLQPTAYSVAEPRPVPQLPDQSVHPAILQPKLEPAVVTAPVEPIPNIEPATIN